jgi:hypothetical protein
MPQLRENSRHGVPSWNPALYPGHFVCNSRTAIGLQFEWSGIVSGPVVAAIDNDQLQQFAVAMMQDSGMMSDQQELIRQQKQQDCLNKINNTPDGEFYNFFSLASPFIGPDPMQSTIEDVGGTGLKFAAYGFFRSASANMIRTPFGSMSGLVADTLDTVAKGFIAVGGSRSDCRSAHGARGMCHRVRVLMGL